jgi:hypothetical protein
MKYNKLEYETYREMTVTGPEYILQQQATLSNRFFLKLLIYSPQELNKWLDVDLQTSNWMCHFKLCDNIWV